jgi:hypothetical protein
MDLFIEKEFAENFQIEYYPEKESEIQKIINSIFSKYPGINWYLNTSEDFIEESELLLKLSDLNLNCRFNVDFDKLFTNEFVPKKQTLVLTEKPRSWFTLLKAKGILCFSYDNYEKELKDFISKTHFKVDLSDEDNIPINWKIFQYLNNNTNFIILSDPYILKDNSGQKIKNNLIPLLKENLNKTLKYNVFIFTIADENIERKLKFIYSQLASFKIKIYVFNIQKSLEKFKMHDRLLYSNYAITESGSGFNLSSKKPINSQILSASVFETYTYKRFQHHLKELKEYVQKLERFEHYNNLFKANTKNAFKVFNEMI